MTRYDDLRRMREAKAAKQRPDSVTKKVSVMPPIKPQAPPITEKVSVTAPIRPPGRPRSPDALSNAERQRRHRWRAKHGIEPPEVVQRRILDALGQHKAVAEAYRKICKATRFDDAAWDEIKTAIKNLTRKWHTVLSAREPARNADADGEPKPPPTAQKPL